MLHIPPMTQLAGPGEHERRIVGEIDHTVRCGFRYRGGQLDVVRHPFGRNAGAGAFRLEARETDNQQRRAP
jgi:hypothetical protein